MIPATQPHKAHYKHQTDGPDGKPQVHYSTKPVIAWDGDGAALVADESGRLRPAYDWSNFHHVAPAKGPVVAALPGDGWRSEFTFEGSLHSWPIAAWLVRDDGECEPATVDRDGLITDPTTAGNFTRLFHPDEEVESGERE
ncbi:hypothetical protein [Streptomyces violaceusniger]|uniref:Uncharacterized protein n=1 Tax=Streptomyces violaceusniger (strain Tu 4113) TaxID=653045 RepID=G2P795_STRV4|nr:hypothetical protein [Streptomyces violaceusniger]AEM87055.1 hypothetical protein Strvi_7720 [Streptomyces violaceusniger Tu 4113]